MLTDLTQVSEARQGPLPKVSANLLPLLRNSFSRVPFPFQDPKLLFDLEQRGSKETLEERSLMLVDGLDFVNTRNTHLVAQDVATAKVRAFSSWLEEARARIHFRRG